MNGSSRVRVGALAAAVATVLVAAPATAAAPTQETTQFESDAVYDDLCSFPLRIQMRARC